MYEMAACATFAAFFDSDLVQQAQCIAPKSALAQVEISLIVRYCRDIVSICLFWIVFDSDLVQQQAQCAAPRSASVEVEIF